MGCSPPQLRQRMPRIRRPVCVLGTDGVSIAMVILRDAGERSGPGYGRPSWTDRGPRREDPLSCRMTCPDLAPCRCVGRLSWLQRAGPSATLDKSSSVVCGCYGLAGPGVNDAPPDGLREATRRAIDTLV